MRWFAALLIYRLLLPLLFLTAFPGWIVKMLRRGGFGTRLGERAAVYSTEGEFEPHGAVHIHAISVGEALLALKLIREWLLQEPERRFVLATGTATGHQVAASAAIASVHVTYAPLDFRFMVRRYLNRFEPARIVLIEGEAWPHLLLGCRKRGIPVSLVNARMSPRSARRYRKFAAWLRPLFSMLDAVAIQETEDAEIWRELGVPQEHIHHTGSLKFDPAGGARPVRRPEFQEMLDAFGANRRIILAASTHAGEDAWIARAVLAAAPDTLPVIVPRHAERREEVKAELERAGFDVVLRSRFHAPAANGDRRHVFVIDSTGELRDWTAHADVVIIGKSFLATGGQNPGEAMIAGKPVIFGPHMENFQPLADHLAAANGCIRALDENDVQKAIITALDPTKAEAMTRSAARILKRHEGATRRVITLLTAPETAPN
jgi:3-deoxy-D-manno-octulosonic-acid transferase